MNTFWSSLGTLDSLMMDAGSLPCEGTCGLMMGIEVWVAIGTGDAAIGIGGDAMALGRCWLR
jgi:hypothetical protein